MRDATQALTVLAEIAPASRALLEQQLAAIAADLDGNPIFRPCELPDTHFTALVIIDDPRGELPALLAWESNHDGRAADYLAAVARTAPSISAVFACCADYPADGVTDPERWARWMLARSCRAAAFYAGYRGVPRRAVIGGRRIHDAIRDALDHEDRDALCRLSPSDLQRRICELALARVPEVGPLDSSGDELRWLVGKLAAITAALVVLPLALVVLPAWYLVLRHKESRDFTTAYARPIAVDPAVRAREDQVSQNHLTHVVDIKPGVFRLATLWLVLTAVDVVARVYSVRGNLAGIPTIHFARWVIVPDRRRGHQRVQPARHRLVFFSNHDGSWDSYLGEFIDRAASWVTAVWSNAIGFPSTSHLAGGGARNEAAFKQWTREHQLVTQVWWSGVPDATVQNVRDDVWIHQQLTHGLPDHELDAWLRKL